MGTVYGHTHGMLERIPLAQNMLNVGNELAQYGTLPLHPQITTLQLQFSFLSLSEMRNFDFHWVFLVVIFQVRAVHGRGLEDADDDLWLD